MAATLLDAAREIYETTYGALLNPRLATSEKASPEILTAPPDPTSAQIRESKAPSEPTSAPIREGEAPSEPYGGTRLLIPAARLDL